MPVEQYYAIYGFAEKYCNAVAFYGIDRLYAIPRRL